MTWTRELLDEQLFEPRFADVQQPTAGFMRLVKDRVMHDGRKLKTDAAQAGWRPALSDETTAATVVLRTEQGSKRTWS